MREKFIAAAFGLNRPTHQRGSRADSESALGRFPATGTWTRAVRGAVKETGFVESGH
jgi:hypothetical protein